MTCGLCGDNNSTGYNFVEETEYGPLCRQCRATLPERVGYRSAADYAANETDLPPVKTIRAVLLELVRQQSARSMLWRALACVGLWWFIGREAAASMPDAGVLLHPGLLVGAGILFVCAALGAYTRGAFGPWLDALSLCVIAAVVVLGTFSIMTTPQPRSQRPFGPPPAPNTTPFTIALVGGVGFGVSGVRRMARLVRIATVEDTSPEELQAALNRLTSLCAAEADPAKGRLKCVATKTVWFPWYSETSTPCVLWLLPKEAICLPVQLDDAFQFDRGLAAGKVFDTSPLDLGSVYSASPGKMVLDQPSLAAWNEWCQLNPAIKETVGV